MKPPDPGATCPTCGGPLESTDSRWFCPACLWREFEEGEAVPVARDAAEGLFAVEGHVVLAEIARGGGGIVYRARQAHPAREVALKMLPPHQLGGERAIAAFRFEAELVAGLDHPGILPVYVVGEYRGMPFFTMKLAEGGSLAARRDSYRGRWREIAELMVALADAVQFGHSRGVIHRDLKPGNVLFDREDRAYVADFGLAKSIGDGAVSTQTMQVHGTPIYLAPEVVAGGAKVATVTTDVYGLGAILYELLGGRPPFAAGPLPALLRRILEDEPPWPVATNERVAADLAAIALRALAKDPARRFSSVAEFAEDLNLWLQGRPVSSRPVGTVGHLWAWTRRNPVFAMIWVLLFAVLLGGNALLDGSNKLLRRALEQTRSVEEEARGRLHAALVSKAKLQQQSRQVGQRFKSLASLEEAARIRPTLEVRSAMAASLALPEVRRVRTLPATFLHVRSTVDFSPDFSRYFVVEGDGTLVMRSMADGAILRRISSSRGAILRGSFSRDGERFVADLANNSREFWRVNGERADWFSEGPTQCAMHPARSRVLFRRGDSEIVERDLEQGAERVVKSGGARIFSLSYSPSADRIAVVRKDAIEMLTTAAGETEWILPWTPIGLQARWRADGTQLTTGTLGSGEFHVRSAGDGRTLRTFSGHATYVDFIEFLPGDRELLSGAFDRSVRLWDAATGTLLWQMDSAGRGVGASPDGSQFACVDDEERVAVFSLEPSPVFRELPQSTELFFDGQYGFDPSADGRWLLVQHGDGTRIPAYKALCVWDSAGKSNPASCALLAMGDKRSSAFFHPDNRRVVYSLEDSGVFSREIFTGPDGRATFGGERVVSADGSLLLGINRAGDWYVNHMARAEISVWPQGNPASSRLLLKQTGTPEPILVSADLRWAVTFGRAAKVLRVWSLAEPGALPRPLTFEHEARVQFSPDGHWLVVGTAAGYSTWSLPELQPGPAWPATPDGDPWRVMAFSPDGAWLACETQRSAFELRDTRDFSLRVRLDPPLDLQVASVRWAPDGTRLWLSGRGPRIFSWDLVALRRELKSRGLDW